MSTLIFLTLIEKIRLPLIFQVFMFHVFYVYCTSCVLVLTGQVTIQIEVKAIKVPQKSVQSIIKGATDATSKAGFPREWFSIEDVRQQIAV